MTRNLHLLFSIGLVLSVNRYSQTVRGTILGTVTDASGAVVRGAKVTAVQTATGLSRTELTNGEITSAGVQDARASSRQIQFALRMVF